MDYKIRDAAIADHDAIYALKSESVRPYVEKIWGWDEDFQRKDFDSDFSATDQFKVMEVNGKFAGFMQSFRSDECFSLIEIHLLPEYRGMGIGSDILRNLQKSADNQECKIQIGCFKENHRAKALYERLNFIQVGETETHYLLEYSK